LRPLLQRAPGKGQQSHQRGTGSGDPQRHESRVPGVGGGADGELAGDPPQVGVGRARRDQARQPPQECLQGPQRGG
jgi:hypothetical protein